MFKNDISKVTQSIRGRDKTNLRQLLFTLSKKCLVYSTDDNTLSNAYKLPLHGDYTEKQDTMLLLDVSQVSKNMYTSTDGRRVTGKTMWAKLGQMQLVTSDVENT